MTAVALLAAENGEIGMEILSQKYLFLKELFKLEFILEIDTSPDRELSSVLEYFHDREYITKDPETMTFRITRQGFEKLSMWGAMVKTFIESYWIAARTMGQTSKKSVSGENLLKHMDYTGKKYYKLGVVEHIGALSRLNFKNAVTLVNREYIVPAADSDDKKGIDHEKLAELIRTLYDLSHCVRH
jgi:glycerol-3-phosphate O-acyltransferase